MYCRTCGKQVADQAVYCVACGCPPRVGNQFCCNCGSQTLPQAVVCTRCGVAFTGTTMVSPEAKSKLAAGLLGIFLGSFGVHRFYLGFIGIGIAQIAVTLVYRQF